MLRPLFIVTAIFLTSACKPNEPNKLPQNSCILDNSKIHSWSKFGDLKQEELPYMKTYEGCEKTLIYVAASHGNDAESPTFKMVRSAFDNHAINFAIVEGFPSAYGISDPQLLDYAKSVKGTASDAEAYEAIRLAIEKGAVFQGGEPDEKVIVDAIQKAGKTPVDLLGFYIVRQIPQYIRQNNLETIEDPRLDAEIDKLVQNLISETGIDRTELSAVDSAVKFKNWYWETNKMLFKESFRNQDAWPSTSISDPRPTNFISDQVGDIRDQHIVSVINRALQDNTTVLVVYGGSHHVIQEPALKSVFGESK